MNRLQTLPLTLSLFAAMALAAPSALAAGKMLGKYTDAEVITVAKQLVREFDVPVDKEQEIVAQAKLTMAGPKFKKMRGKRRISGVFVYTIGEGGFIVKFMGGHGLVAFKGAKKANIKLKSTSFGAQIGGSREWGVGLILDLKYKSHFGGGYSGSVTGAIGGPDGTVLTRLKRKKVPDEIKEHDVWLMGSAKGLSAGAAKTSLTITVLK